MSAIYAPDECDCALIDAGGGFPGLAVQRSATEREACLAYLGCEATFAQSFTVEMPPLARYFAVHGPGGHVIGVNP